MSDWKNNLRYINYLWKIKSRNYKIYPIKIDSVVYGLTENNWISPKQNKKTPRLINMEVDTILIEKHYVWLTIVQRFVEKMSWENTEQFKLGLSRINEGQSYRNCKNKEDLKEHFKKWDRLYCLIKQNGFMTNHYMYQQKIVSNPMDMLDEVSFVINHLDKPVLNDGWHRFCISKLLGVKNIEGFIL